MKILTLGILLISISSWALSESESTKIENPCIELKQSQYMKKNETFVIATDSCQLEVFILSGFRITNNEEQDNIKIVNNAAYASGGFMDTIFYCHVESGLYLKVSSEWGKEVPLKAIGFSECTKTQTDRLVNIEMAYGTIDPYDFFTVCKEAKDSRYKRCDQMSDPNWDF